MITSKMFFNKTDSAILLHSFTRFHTRMAVYKSFILIFLISIILSISADESHIEKIERELAERRSSSSTTINPMELTDNRLINAPISCPTGKINVKNVCRNKKL